MSARLADSFFANSNLSVGFYSVKVFRLKQRSGPHIMSLYHTCWFRCKTHHEHQPGRRQQAALANVSSGTKRTRVSTDNNDFILTLDHRAGTVNEVFQKQMSAVYFRTVSPLLCHALQPRKKQPKLPPLFAHAQKEHYTV